MKQESAKKLQAELMMIKQNDKNPENFVTVKVNSNLIDNSSIIKSVKLSTSDPLLQFP